MMMEDLDAVLHRVSGSASTPQKGSSESQSFPRSKSMDACARRGSMANLKPSPEFNSSSASSAFNRSAAPTLLAYPGSCSSFDGNGYDHDNFDCGVSGRNAGAFHNSAASGGAFHGRRACVFGASSALSDSAGVDEELRSAREEVEAMRLIGLMRAQEALRGLAHAKLRGAMRHAQAAMHSRAFEIWRRTAAEMVAHELATAAVADARRLRTEEHAASSPRGGRLLTPRRSKKEEQEVLAEANAMQAVEVAAAEARAITQVAVETSVIQRALGGCLREAENTSVEAIEAAVQAKEESMRAAREADRRVACTSRELERLRAAAAATGAQLDEARGLVESVRVECEEMREEAEEAKRETGALTRQLKHVFAESAKREAEETKRANLSIDEAQEDCRLLRKRVQELERSRDETRRDVEAARRDGEEAMREARREAEDARREAEDARREAEDARREAASVGRSLHEARAECSAMQRRLGEASNEADAARAEATRSDGLRAATALEAKLINVAKEAAEAAHATATAEYNKAIERLSEETRWAVELSQMEQEKAEKLRRQVEELQRCVRAVLLAHVECASPSHLRLACGVAGRQVRRVPRRRRCEPK